MKSSSSVSLPRGVLDQVIFSSWTLADLAGDLMEAPPEPEVDEEAERAREEAEAEARAEAEALLREEEACEAERLAAEAVEARVREAYQQGYDEGRSEGEIAEGARLRSAVMSAEEALDEIRASEVRWTGSIEENLCALSVAIARHVIGRELRDEVETVLALVRDALAEFPIDQPIRIRLSPQDLGSIRQNGGDETTDPLLRDRDARWIADPQVAPGGVMVEGRERLVDGRVDSALERIYRRMTYNHA